jgi:hypothetical protein
VQRVRLEGLTRCGDLVGEIHAAVKSSFHASRVFSRLAVSRADFRSLGLSFNAALQYLVMLSALDVWAPSSAPAMSHAVSTQHNQDREDNVDWIVVPTHGLMDLYHAWKARARSPAELLAMFRAPMRKHADKVARCRSGYCPTFFVEPPRSAPMRRLAQFFIDSVSRYEPAYKNYLFRALRQKGTMDLMTSCFDLPASLLCLSRPGVVCEVTELIGVHMFIRPHRVDLVFLPHPTSLEKIDTFDRAFARWTDDLLGLARAEPRSSQARQVAMP